MLVLRGSDVTNYLSLPRRHQAGDDVDRGRRPDRLAADDAALDRLADVEGPPVLGHRLRALELPTSSPTSPRRSGSSRTSRREAYPSKQNPWGVQNFWVELLADTGRRRVRARRRDLRDRARDRAADGAWRRLVRRPRRRRASSSSRPAPGTRSGSSPASRSTRSPGSGSGWRRRGLARRVGTLRSRCRLRARGDGARHRRRRLHRLEPRAGAARARRRGARARQLLDRLAGEPRGARRRDRRGRAAQLRARPQRRPRRRGRLPPRRARLGAALGAGPAHLERRQRRGHAERAARRARRGRAPRRLLVVDARCTGRAATLPTREDSPPDPISPYGVAKLAAERYCIAFSRVYEAFETVVLRYFNVFGPRQSPTSQYAAVVPLFITAIAAGQPITIHGDGEQSRDFTYVDNVVDATIAAAGAAGRERPRLQRRRRRAGERQPRRRHDRRDPRPAGREGLRAVAPGRHPRLVGRPDRRARGARLRAGGLARGRPAADGGGALARR